MKELPSSLVVPQQKSAPSGSEQFTPDELNSWLKQWRESCTDAKQILSQLTKYQSECNTTQLDPGERFQLLEKVRSTASPLLSRLENQLIASSFPLSEENFGILEQLRQCLIEQIIGYKAVVWAQDNNPSWSLSSEQAVPLQRMAELLSHLLFQSSILYVPYPKGIWQELHGLYQFSATSADKVVNAKKIDNIYRQAVLFSICSPQRLRQDEMKRLKDSLPAWIEEIEIKETPAGKINTPAILINLDADAPPFHSSDLQDIEGNHWLTIETANLLQQLRQIFNQEQINTGSHAKSLNTPLLRRIIQTIGVSKQREFLRIQGNLSLEVTFGIASTGQLLNELCQKDDIETARVEALLTTSLAVINESATGYCVAFPSSVEADIEIGELVGIRQAPRQCSIGIIRWIQNKDANDARLGLEIIANTATGIVVQNPEIENFTRKPALLLPAIRATGQPQSLIIQTSPTQVGDSLVLNGLGPVTLTKRIETTASFEQFLFSPTVSI